MATLPPRVVFVTRETDYELLIARHGTREQARFFLEARGQRIEDVEAPHRAFAAALRTARAATPADWRQTLVVRSDFDRFLFAPEDIVVAVGQDGLVANVAKYLQGQAVLGINPAPDRYDGVLVRHAPTRLKGLLPATAARGVKVQRRTMVEAQLDNGDSLLALNEIFIGHRSHQSARYQIRDGDTAENHSSSGLIVASGTGMTGWARSILEATGKRMALKPEDPAVAYLVREPFPSVATRTGLQAGRIDATPLRVTSRMGDGGVIFADGIEQDFAVFEWGRTVTVRAADRALNLVVG